MWSFLSYGFFFVLGFFASTYDFNNVFNKFNDVKTLYISTFEKEKSHWKSSCKLFLFLYSMYSDKLKRYVNHQLYNHISLNNDKVLCSVQVNNKTRFLPICSTQLRIPDIMDIKFEKDMNNTNEKLNELVTKDWLQNNLMSIISIHKLQNFIKPVDLGLKSLSLTILNDDIESFTFNENDDIKLFN